MWFEGWARLGGLVVIAVVVYAVLVASLRISGKRTLTRMNAFDMVITIALGSTLSTVVVSRDVPLTDGVVAVGVLVVLQLSVALAAQRWRSVRRAVRSAPTAVLVHGSLDRGAMEAVRLTEGEVAQALRREGVGSFRHVDLVVLESDGSLSVIADVGDRSALGEVDGAGALVGPGGEPTAGDVGRGAAGDDRRIHPGTQG